MAALSSQDIKLAFPKIQNISSSKTSDPDPCYNCIAWAFGDNNRFWWPNKKWAYWPLQTMGMSDSEAFADLFLKGGWHTTDNHGFETHSIKVSLFALNGVPTHAARLLPSGKWTSKLGAWIDISHEFSELDGPEYGQVLTVYRKAILPTS
jgi:hypothetical protein